MPDHDIRVRRRRNLLAAVTLLLSGRAMTIAFLGDAGSGLPGDPPEAWTMPLLGDAVIGVSSLLILYLIVKTTGLGTWVAIVVWNALGIWDALAAFVVHRTVPWPEFFMIEVFGSSMFFAASAMHLLAIWLVTGHRLRTFYLSPSAP